MDSDSKEGKKKKKKSKKKSSTEGDSEVQDMFGGTVVTKVGEDYESL